MRKRENTNLDRRNRDDETVIYGGIEMDISREC